MRLTVLPSYSRVGRRRPGAATSWGILNVGPPFIQQFVIGVIIIVILRDVMFSKERPPTLILQF